MIRAGDTLMDYSETLALLREDYGTATLVLAAGLFVGVLAGALMEATKFCLRSAVIEANTPAAQRNPIQIVQFGAAMLAALLATQAMSGAGLIDLGQSIYHTAPLAIVGIIVGGFAFGVGMILTNGCVSRLTVLAGTGNLRAWFTLLVIGITGYATMRGLLAYPRTRLADAGPVIEANHTIPELTGLSAEVVTLAFALILAGGLAVFARQVGWHRVAAGAAVGVVATGSWVATGIIGFDDFEPTPLVGFSFTAPVAETIQYAMIATGDTMKFGTALVIGLMLGAFASAFIGGRLSIVGFQSERAPLRYALGGTLMGFGAVAAVGCTVGQGLSGFSTLSAGSLLAVASIIAGGSVAHRALQPRSATTGTAVRNGSAFQPAE
jgi:uncharacterized membrane protein YedE/YeeE